jgi:hypothetical protein
MSQAENRNTTIPTRRAVLAGAPAAAALAAGAATGGIATALAAPRTGRRSSSSQKYLKFQHQPMCVN